MNTFYLNTVNNKDQSYYDQVAHNTQNIVRLKEGDFIILKRPNWFNMNYVWHGGKLRFIGEY